MKKKMLTASFCTLLLVQNMYCLPALSDFFPAGSEYPEQLRSGEQISLYHNEEFVPELMPSSTFSDRFKTSVASFNPNMGIEGLFLIPLEDEERDLLAIANTLCSVSTLQGLHYYSASRDEMRLLFEESYRMESFEHPIPVEDPQISDLPGVYSYAIHQKDSTFGKSDSVLNLYGSETELMLEQINQTPLRYNGIIRVVAPENLQTMVLVIPCREGWIYYGIMATDTLNVSMFKNRASQSFYNRMMALFQWFMEQLEQS